MKQTPPPVINAEEFPQLPSYGARWQPLLFSPISGSEESLTVALIAKGADGHTEARFVLNEKQLHCLFKDAADAIHEKILICVNDAIDALNFRLSLDDWEPPLSGFQMGQAHNALASDMRGILQQATRLGTALGSSLVTNEGEEAQAVELRNTKWVSQIRKSVRITDKKIAKLFDREVASLNGRFTETVGFFSGTYAANFAVIGSSSRSYRQAIRAAQGRLWQLDQLRDAQIIDSPKSVELIVGHPDPEQFLLTDIEIERINDGIDELKLEAVKKEIAVFDSSDPIPAAQHILKKARLCA